MMREKTVNRRRKLGPNRAETESGMTGRVRAAIEFIGTDSDILQVRLSGRWQMGEALPNLKAVLDEAQNRNGLRRVVFDGARIEDWDTRLLIYLVKLAEMYRQRGVEIDVSRLPAGVRRLIELATMVPRKETHAAIKRDPWLVRLGKRALDWYDTGLDMVAFVGECCLALVRFVAGKACYRRSDLGVVIEASGVRALGIASLICVLVGMILAFVGAVQLRMFGAQIYVADLVGLGMVREMGAMMTAIIMAGRTGASFAAELGTMQVNEEIDALRTLGVAPMEFLVIPRMIGLTLMMPLLCVYADLMGMLGGMTVGVGVFDLNVFQYITQTIQAVGLVDLGVGVFKSIIFGLLIALFGCYFGIRCGRSSAAVGIATTSAVVSCIVSIIVSDALLTFVTTVVGI